MSNMTICVLLKQTMLQIQFYSITSFVAAQLHVRSQLKAKCICLHIQIVELHC